MTITRTVTVDGITVTRSITLTEEELKQAHHEHQAHLEAKADALDLLSTLMSPFMKNVLSSGIAETEEEAAAYCREYFHEKYAADIALNETEEEPTDAE